MNAPVEKTLPARAHNGEHAAELGHRDGFCLACAEIYQASEDFLRGC